MADFTGIALAASSIERYLRRCFEEEPPVPGTNTGVLLVRTEDFADSTTSSPLRSLPSLSLFLYRVDFNKTMRSAWAAMGHRDGEAHLPLDLHFLLTPWAENTENEYRILGRAMQCIENMPILSGPLLDSITEREWAASEAVQLCLEDLSTEDVMRIFDSLPVDYKLSVPYLARTIVLDGGETRLNPLVTVAVSGTNGRGRT
ncbi:MAG: DUF4255 domain-containing protein [Candidatus Electrothrix communis]|nr:MAG: DUF4255 domain-containing protein [Candidatus Electrothrix communis]